MFSNWLNLGRNKAARMCAESSAFGFDQINPRWVCQNWLLPVLTWQTYSHPAGLAIPDPHLPSLTFARSVICKVSPRCLGGYI